LIKQDEKQRARRRLQDQAIEMAAKSRWQEAVDINLQMISLGEDADSYNRLGKAYFEVGNLQESHNAYQNALRLNPNNTIAKKNLARLQELITRGDDVAAPIKTTRQLIDLRLFITETGRTCLTTLVDVPRGAIIDALVTGEKVELQIEGRNVLVIDADNNIIGRLEPKLAQRLNELMSGGNRYTAAIANISGGQIRLLIREIYQDPSQRGRISFPGKLGEGALHSGYISTGRYDDYGEDLLDDEDDVLDDHDDIEEETFGSDEEELGLDDIEQDLGDDDDGNEE
jgi:tetratricopeptide (TPR) repeat protein